MSQDMVDTKEVSLWLWDAVWSRRSWSRGSSAVGLIETLRSEPLAGRDLAPIIVLLFEGFVNARSPRQGFNKRAAQSRSPGG